MSQTESEALPTVSVLVPTYNRRNLLPRVIEPLLADPTTTEVVCVVDGSDDGSLEWLRKRSEGDPRLRPLSVERVGRTAARRAGLEASVGDVILLIDDDVVADPGLVTGHARRHDETADAVVAGYMPTPKPDRRRAGNFLTFMYSDQYESHCTLWEEKPEDILLHLWGGNLSIRRRDIERVGGLELPGMDYHGDFEFGLRCHKAGLKGVFDRGLRASHLHQRTIAGLMRDARAQGRSWERIGELHADLRRQTTTGARRGGRLDSLARLLAAPAIEPFARPCLFGFIHVLGRLHAFGFEERTTLLLRRVEQERGRREARSAEA